MTENVIFHMDLYDNQTSGEIKGLYIDGEGKKRKFEVNINLDKKSSDYGGTQIYLGDSKMVFELDSSESTDLVREFRRNNTPKMREEFQAFFGDYLFRIIKSD